MVERFAPADLRDAIVGDLAELHARQVERRGRLRAALWYWRHAAVCALRLGSERLRDRRNGGRSVQPLGMSWLDWKLGARMLLKHPGLTLIGGVSIAGAICIGALLFDFVPENVQPRIPLHEGDRLVRLENWDAAAGAVEPRSMHDFLLWRDGLTQVTELSAARTSSRNLFTPDGRPHPVQVAELTASAMPITRVAPLLGRPLLDADAAPGAEPVVVLGYDIWQRLFNGEGDIVGRTIQLGRTERTVVGVMPEGFRFPRSERVWVPLHAGDTPPREGPPLLVFGRLAAGATPTSAQAELSAVGERLAATNPATHAQLRPRLRAYAGRLAGDPLSKELLAAYLVIFLILTVVCMNVATLVFARTAMRESEITVRNALGASRARVVGQILIESFVLTGVAAIVGLILAQTVMRFAWHQITVVMDMPQPFWMNGTIEPATIVFVLGLAIAGAALIGIVPALKATGPALQAGLQGLSGAGTKMRFGGVWSVIIIGQVAITVVALPLAVAISMEAFGDYTARRDYPSDRYLTFQLAMDAEGTDGRELTEPELHARLELKYAELRERLLSESGVADVTYVDRLPGVNRDMLHVEVQHGKNLPAPLHGNLDGAVTQARVATNYFDVFDIPLVAGRGFTAADADGVSRNVVVNEAFARKLGASPVGARVRPVAAEGEQPERWYEIVGVVEDMNVEPTGGGEAEFIFHAARTAEASPLTVAVRTLGNDPAAFAPRLAAVVLGVDRGLRLTEVATLNERLLRRVQPILFASLAVTILAAVAMILAASGVFALMSLAVARRSREIGVRVALGASHMSVLRTLFTRAAMQVGIGIVIGNLLVLQVAGLSRTTILPMLAVSATMALVGVAACTLPARRALRIQPTMALRQD
jgi:putative ABC transport system permease protein